MNTLSGTGNASVSRMNYEEKWQAERERAGFLALADGAVFRGVAFGAREDRLGEAVFNTGMSGYQEIATDPSYAGQIVALTTAEVGNYGTNLDDAESRGLFLSGLVVNDLAEPSNFRSTLPLDKLLADKSSTYLKSPAGIFTLATIPADQINVQDTINSAKLTFTRYNDVVDSPFKLNIPSTVLLVRLDDYLNGFFENYQVNDSKESYLASFNKSTNTYQFSNIARLITRMAKEKKEGKATANWNKVLLIPVQPTKDSSGNIVKLNHDFSMSSARLVGGKTDKIKLEVIYTNFKSQKRE